MFRKRKLDIEFLTSGALAHIRLGMESSPRPADGGKIMYSARKPGEHSPSAIAPKETTPSDDLYDLLELRSILSQPLTDANAGEINAALEKIKNRSFGKKLLDLIDERGVRPSKIYKAADVDRRLYSRITTDFSYKPSKDTCVAFALALHLTPEETVDLLSRAGYALSHSSKRDLILEYLISVGQYDLITVNTVLDQLGEKILGR